MKKLFLPISALMALSVATSAQKARIFAITGDVKGNVNWNSVREIKGSDGSIKSTLYSPSTAAKTTLSYQSLANRNKSPNGEAAFSAIAATGFDAKTNRLYFTNMRGNTLNYVDLNEDNLTVVNNDDAAFNSGDKFKSEANIITRMCFGADGAGYALSNDAEHLIRFTTDSKPVVTNLGRLSDGVNNGDKSIHTSTTSWGGDIVGDAFGNLYLINMHSDVYKINTQRLVADFVGSIKGLPEGFTTNGAAVNEEGDLVVSSAIYTDSYFKVDISSLKVTGTVKSEGGVFNASDLASSNLLYQSKVASTTSIAASDKVSIYPNPAVGKSFQLNVASAASGKFALSVTDNKGRKVLENFTTSNETLKVNLPKSTPAGVYILKVTNAANQTVHTQKIIVQ